MSKRCAASCKAAVANGQAESGGCAVYTWPDNNMCRCAGGMFKCRGVKKCSGLRALRKRIVSCPGTGLRPVCDLPGVCRVPYNPPKPNC